MDIQEYWEKALKCTEIIRPRVQPLMVSESTHLPYVFLAESSVNIGDTVVRKGEVVVEKPSIILPPDHPQLAGFEFEEEPGVNQDILTNFLLVRGVRFPSMKYNNKTHSLDIHEGRLKRAIQDYLRKLEREENIHSGLIVGPEDCWMFSVLIFVCSQAVRSADRDIQKLLDEYKRKKDD